VRKGVAARMKECSPRGIYVHCYGHLLNLALQDTMKEIEPLRNALGIIQSLYNFLEGSPKRHAVFKSVDLEDDLLVLTLKSLSVMRWSCRFEAVRCITEQMPRIMKALLILSDDHDPKTFTDSTALLNAVSDFQFVFGLHLLKVILSNTNALCKYLQGKSMDVITARRHADLTIKVLSDTRNEENYDLLWMRSHIFAEQMIEEVKNTRFTFKEARTPRKTPSRHFQALVGELSTAPLLQTAKDYYRINTYYRSLDKVICEIKSRFDGNDQDILCALGEIVLSDAPSQESFHTISIFYGIVENQCYPCGFFSPPYQVS